MILCPKPEKFLKDFINLGVSLIDSTGSKGGGSQGQTVGNSIGLL